MRNKITTLFLVLYSLGLSHVEAQNAVPVNLGRAENFVILSNEGIINSQHTSITGNIGTGSGSSTMTDISSALVDGKVFSADTLTTPGSILNLSLLEEALADADAARAFMDRTCYDFTEIFEGDLSGKTLIPGVYEWTNGVMINEDVIIDGNEDDIWIFKVLGPFTQAENTRIILNGDAKTENIYWYVTGNTSIGPSAHFEGVLLGSKNIIMEANAQVNGRLIAREEIILYSNTVYTGQGPRLTITTTADTEYYEAIGQVINYTVVLSNTGDVPVNNIQITDEKITLNETVTQLEPQKSVTFRRSYTVSITDFYYGTIVNTVTAIGKDPEGQDVTASDTKTITVLFYLSELVVEKTADRETFSEIGETIEYTIVVINDGTVNVYDIDIYDPLTGLEANLHRLEACHRRTFYASYKTTYEDMCNGSVVNTATAIGTDSQGESVGASDEAIVVADFDFTALHVEKTANKEVYRQIGELITYTIVVTNTGHSTINDLVVSDPITGFQDTIAALKQCTSASYTVNYAVTEEDLINGRIVNTATASGKGPDDQHLEASDKETVIGIFDPAIRVLKVADQQTYNQAGDRITFGITLENTGNVTIHDLVIEDQRTNDRWTIESLSPGSRETFEAVYIITQQDMDIGIVTNSVTAIGLDPLGDEVEDSSDATISGVIVAELEVNKTSMAETFSTAGEELNFTITIENTGNVTLTDVQLSDDLTDDHWTIAILLPGEQRSFVVSYTITQEDIDRGSLTNLAFASGKGPQDQITEDSGEETVDARKDTGLSLVKTASQETYSQIGEEINYTIIVQNNGNTTLIDIYVTDELTTESWLTDILLPGELANFSTSHTISQEDIDGGAVSNIALVTAVTPSGEALTDSAMATVTAIQTAGIEIEKITAQERFSQPGESITYTLLVKNTGNVSLFDLTISDELTNDSWSMPMLGPGEAETFTTIYTITQEDIDNGLLTNVANVIAYDPNEQTVADSDSVTITASSDAKLEITKTASQQTYSQAGEVITFNILITNTGNVTISDIEINDDLTGDTWFVTSLLPEASESFSVNYTISQDDLDNGSVSNKVVASGKGADEEDISAEDQVTITAIRNPALSITKTADRQQFSATGESIVYTIEIANTGNVTLTQIQANDELTDESWTFAAIYPGNSQLLQTTYIVTQHDIDVGEIYNLAVASGTDPEGNELHAEDDATVTAVDLTASLSVVKTASQQTYSTTGQPISYTITVTNTGQLTLSDITVTDDLTNETWTIETLVPGHSESVTATYLISQADIDRGSVANLVSVSGNDPAGQPVTGDDHETIFADITSQVTITKTANPTTYNAIGDLIWYVIQIQNTGNVSLAGILVNDDLTGESWTSDQLLPGESLSFHTSYVITQELIDQGLLQNTATVSALDPQGNEVSGSADETVRAVNRMAEISVLKSSERPVYALAGDVIDYTIKVTNTGNLTLSDITIRDDLTGETWTIPIMAPGQSQEFQTSYSVSRADIDVGQVINIASAQGYDPDGNMISDMDEVTAIAIRVPGGLTPDTPYDNILVIKGIDHYPNNTFRIYNRYGTMVYEASPYRNDWVGVPNRGLILTDADGKVPAGTYFYMLVLEPGQKPFSGYIYLIKSQ